MGLPRNGDYKDVVINNNQKHILVISTVNHQITSSTTITTLIKVSLKRRELIGAWR